MKKLAKRVLALSMAAAMTVSMAAGCSSAKDSKKTSGSSKDSSVFAVMEQVSKLDSLSMETTISFETDEYNGEVVLSGKKDGDKSSLSVQLNAVGMKYKLDDVMVVDGDTVYFNYKEINDELGSLIKTAGVDLNEYGISSDWISLKLDGMSTDVSSIADIYGDLDKAFSDVITTKSGKSTLKVDDEDSYKAFADALKKALTDNKDSWSNLIADYYSKIDAKAMVENLIDEMAGALIDKMGDMAEGITKENLLEALMDNSDLSALENTMDAGDIASAIDDMISEMDAAGYEDFGGTFEIVSSAKDGEYTITASVTDKDGMKADINTVIKDESVNIEVPSDAQSAVDIIAQFVFAYSLSDSNTGDDSWNDDYDYSDDNKVKTDATLDEVIDSAISYLDSGSFSKQELIEQLEWEGYDSDLVKEAVDKLDADWKAEAVEDAKNWDEYYKKYKDEYTEDDIKEMLEYANFTDEEVDYAMKNYK